MSKTVTDAREFLQALNAAVHKDVPIMSTDRHIGLKEQAKLTRELFKGLGIKSCSVRVATGVGCPWVYIGYPAIHDEDWMSTAHQLLNDLLIGAFPNHNNRSDYQTDYFNFCWTIHPVIFRDASPQWPGTVAFKNEIPDDEIPF